MKKEEIKFCADFSCISASFYFIFCFFVFGGQHTQQHTGVNPSFDSNSSWQAWGTMRGTRNWSHFCPGSCACMSNTLPLCYLSDPFSIIFWLCLYVVNIVWQGNAKNKMCYTLVSLIRMRKGSYSSWLVRLFGLLQP